MKLKEIASRINDHLRRFEKDPVINATDQKYGTRPYYYASAGYYGGARIAVQYISYQGQHSLKKDEAIAYLEWLDAGNVGGHLNIKP